MRYLLLCLLLICFGVGKGQIWQEVDGGVNAGIARSCVDAGADVLVAGSAAFSGGPDMYAANIAALKG